MMVPATGDRFWLRLKPKFKYKAPTCWIEIVTSENGQAFMLSSLKPANGKFVLGPPVETAAPVVVFTGPADRPDPVAQTATAAPKKKKTATGKAEGSEKMAKPAAEKKAAKPAKKADDAKPAKAAKPTKQTKPKVTSATQ